MPTAFRELARLACQHHTNLHRAFELRADTLLELLERCDALRRPERFAELQAKEEFVLTVASSGFGKRTSAYEYRVTGRGGQGIANISLAPRNGRAVVATFSVRPGDDVISYLPLSHVAEQVMSLHGPMTCCQARPAMRLRADLSPPTVDKRVGKLAIGSPSI